MLFQISSLVMALRNFSTTEGLMKMIVYMDVFIGVIISKRKLVVVTLLLKRRRSHSCVDGAEVSIHYGWRQQHRLRALETYLAGQLPNEICLRTFGFVFTMG